MQHPPFGHGQRREIPSLSIRDHLSPRFPLSFAQERLWLVNAAGGDAAGEYNVSFGLRLTGSLDRAALRRALGVVVGRHEVLRSRFVMADTSPVQVVEEVAAEADFELVDVPGPEGEAVLAEMIAQESGRRFDLASGSLLRARLYSLSADEHVLLLNLHHVVTDGWSNGLLASEVSAAYAAVLDGTDPALPELPVQYRDFALWQRERAAEGVFDPGAAYWRDALDGLPALDLPTDRMRPAVRSGRGSEVCFDVADEVASGLRLLARSREVTLFMLTLSVFDLLLCRYSGQQDFGVGVALSGRTRPELENLIGFFVNTLVIRADVALDMPFTQLLGQVRERALAAYEFQDVPFQRLVQDNRPGRDLAQPVLAQVMFQLLNDSEERWSLPGLNVSRYPVPPQTTKFDLDLTLEEAPSGLTGSLGYSEDLFDADTARRMAGHFQSLLAAVVHDPDGRISGLPMLSETEKRELLSFNGTTIPTSDTCIHRLFEEQVTRTPEAVAVESGEQRITYADLNARANRLAHWLRGTGIGPEIPVAICLPSGIDSVTAMLAVLKAGGGYVPLDPDHPVHRLEFMLTDTSPAALITYRDTLPALPRHIEPYQVLLMDDEKVTAVLASQPCHDPAIPVAPHNLAYIMYTSGSTGQPKGVMTTHDSVVSFIEAMDHAGYSPARALLARSSPSLGMATYETWSPLLTGASCIMVPRKLPTVRHLSDIIKESDFDTISLTSAMFNLVVDQAPETLAALHRLWIGGNSVSREHVFCAMRILPGLTLFSAYGPTECTVATTSYRMASNFSNATSTVPIGAPLQHALVYVLDSVGDLVPVGVPGELYIGGAGVARGYLGQPRLTADRFGPDPFGPPGSRLYRTGDLARWHPDGTLEFLGRVDRQVKIRGFRVEPAEVEAALRQQPEVADAVIITHPQSGPRRRLVAYVTWRPGQPEISSTALRTRLQDLLPSYMIPAVVISLSALPLNSNGKVDHSRLPEPNTSQPDLSDDYAAPASPAEEAMVTIWEDVLSINRIGIHDNFFDIGGDSIIAVAVVAAAQSLGINITLRDMMQAQTVALLCELAKSQIPAEASPQTMKVEKPSVPTRALVAIKPAGHRRPIFCVHPSGGSVQGYERMSRWLPIGQPLYAFQPVGLTDNQQPLRSVDEAALLYLAELKAIQPHGPYTILSWSMGGVFALELARLLCRNDEIVAPLVLMEPSFPDRQAFTRLREPLEVYRLGSLMQEELARPDVLPHTRTKLENDFDTLLRTKWFADDDAKLGLKVPIHTMRALLEAYCRYRPRSYEGKLHLFVTQECLGSSPESPSSVAGDSFKKYLRSWDSVVGEVITHQSAGVHGTMFSEPHVQLLAERVVSIIEWEDRQM